jgi:hypothetical protein
MDIVFCVTRPDYPDVVHKNYVKRGIEKFYNPILQKLWCRLITLTIFIAMFVISIIGCIKLENGLEE